ncbi:sugar transferase [Rhodococcus pyridinivorans]
MPSQASVAEPKPGSDQGVVARRLWAKAYIRRLVVTDTLIVSIAVLAAQWVRFGTFDVQVRSEALSFFSYGVVAVVLVASWLSALVIFRTRSPRIVGNGDEEYRRIISSTFGLFGFIAIVTLLAGIDLARLYLAIALPMGLSGLLLGRWLWRRRAARWRRRGLLQTSVLVVGGEQSVRDLIESFSRGTADGYRVVGACVPGPDGLRGGSIRAAGVEVPVLGNDSNVLEALKRIGADAVVITATEKVGHRGIRNLLWELEDSEVDLVIAPGIVDVSGPRLEMRPVAGLPLIHVEKPQYHGAKSFAKSAFDVVFSSLVLLVASPLMAGVAIAIRATSRGPVFYRSVRIGLDGRPFMMLKFRTMVDGAEQGVSALMDRNEGSGLLFKLREDPRVTTVGRILRKYSIDELPQLINVLRREMSVVGPRPPLRREVAAYDGTVRRRLLVKPGMTGLWQVSGRSDLSWEESVRLDLSYVENWSMVGDLLIVVKTLRAVVAGAGAY